MFDRTRQSRESGGKRHEGTTRGKETEKKAIKAIIRSEGNFYAYRMYLDSGSRYLVNR